MMRLAGLDERDGLDNAPDIVLPLFSPLNGEEIHISKFR